MQRPVAFTFAPLSSVPSSTSTATTPAVNTTTITGPAFLLRGAALLQRLSKKEAAHIAHSSNSSSSGGTSILDVGVAVYTANYTLRTGVGTAESLMDFIGSTFLGFMMDHYTITAHALPTPAPTPAPTTTTGAGSLSPQANSANTDNKSGAFSGSGGDSSGSAKWAYMGAAGAVLLIIVGWLIACRLFGEKRAAASTHEPDLEAGDMVCVDMDACDIDVEVPGGAEHLEVVVQAC
jgi:hypothetical protein